MTVVSVLTLDAVAPALLLSSSFPPSAPYIQRLAHLPTRVQLPRQWLPVT